MSRSGTALAIGAATLAGAWLFGSLALAPVGIGLVAAAVGARLWRRAAGTSLRLERSVSARRLVEGDVLEIDLRLTGGASRWSRAVALETVGRLGVREIRLRHGHGSLRWPDIPRGRHVIGPAEVTIEDPLGFERAQASAPASQTVLVRPHVSQLDALFTDTGRDGLDGRRSLVRRAAGVDLHSVRDYQPGEPLRLVHWPTTARRGALTVLELQDNPRDETAVVLDCDPAGVAGPAGRSSFDEAVRVAGSVLAACARRGRPVALAGAAGSSLLRVSGLDGSWEEALDVLAGIEPDERRTLAALLADRRLATARVQELIVISCRPEGIDVAVALERRLAGVVLVDAPTYAGAGPSPPSPTLLRLAAAGVPVTVVRAGQDLATALGGGGLGARSA